MKQPKDLNDPESRQLMAQVFRSLRREVGTREARRRWRKRLDDFARGYIEWEPREHRAESPETDRLIQNYIASSRHV